jgi:hypothetical protein
VKRYRADRVFAFLALFLAISFGVIFSIRAWRDGSAPEPVTSADSDDPVPPSLGAREVEEMLFDGKLGKGWEDWGFGRHDYKAGEPVRVAFSGYGAIIFRHTELPSRFGGVAFRYKAPPEFGHFLQVALKFETRGEREYPRVDLDDTNTRTLPDGWKEVFVPWARLNVNAGPFDRVVIRARRPVANELVSVDKVALTKPTRETKHQPYRRSRVRVDCAEPARRISPWVYGVADHATSLAAPVVRIGGNAMSRLNWDAGNVWNAGSDWYFENVSGETGLSQWLSDAARDDLKVAMTVPLIGWVAKDATSVGFPTARFGKQRAHDPKRPEAGDGHRSDGTPLDPGPPTQTSIPAPPELIERWVRKVREADVARGKRSVHMYILDNEPMLWHATHRDVHPEPVGYDELMTRTLQYAAVIRKADPEALIAGPAEWGWSNYFYSAKDLKVGAAFHPDRRAHGGVPLLPWYLQRLAEHEKKTGVRLLDVVDVHFYPQGKNVYSEKPGDPDTIGLRIRSTRALWDESYRDESWIAEHVKLIPRLKTWVAENYPGRGISIGEWSFGAETHISGALAIAEALGRFGQLGVDYAFYWRAPPKASAGAHAFLAYRNYDGQGAKFEEWTLKTHAPAGVSVFAARNEARTRLTAVVLNLQSSAGADIELDLHGCGEVASSRAFMFQSTPPRLLPGTAAKGKTPSQRFDPYSFGVLELSLKPAAAPR